MKPDINHCLNCNKEISNKAKFCSPKCKMAYRRNKGSVTTTVTNPTVTAKNEPSVTNEFRDSLTKTDKTFYDRAMLDFGEPYYNFIGKLEERKCALLSCGAKFTSNLNLLRYCSYQHYTQSISGKK